MRYSPTLVPVSGYFLTARPRSVYRIGVVPGVPRSGPRNLQCSSRAVRHPAGMPSS
jgi:hypothetical protein